MTTTGRHPCRGCRAPSAFPLPHWPRATTTTTGPGPPPQPPLSPLEAPTGSFVGGVCRAHMAANRHAIRLGPSRGGRRGLRLRQVACGRFAASGNAVGQVRCVTVPCRIRRVASIGGPDTVGLPHSFRRPLSIRRLGRCVGSLRRHLTASRRRPASHRVLVGSSSMLVRCAPLLSRGARFRAGGSRAGRCRRFVSTLRPASVVCVSVIQPPPLL